MGRDERPRHPHPGRAPCQGTGNDFVAAHVEALGRRDACGLRLPRGGGLIAIPILALGSDTPAADSSLPMSQGLFTRDQPRRTTSLLVGTCALVATAAYLGASWLKQSVLGLPLGVWVVGAVMAQSWLQSAVRHRAALPRVEESRPHAGPNPFERLLGRVFAAAWESLRVACRSIRVPRDVFTSFEDRVVAKADRLSGSPRPLRIGLDAGPETRRALMDAPTEIDVEWVVLSPSADDQAALKRHGLDALLRTTGEGAGIPMRIVTLEHPERESAWYDWSTARPLTYASLFPVRVDVARISLTETDTTSPVQAEALSATLRAAAALSRCPARLRLSDHLTGRLPSARSAEGVRTPSSLADKAMLELSAALIAAAPSRSPVAQAAGRVVSAWLASTEAWLDLNLRREGVEAALAAVGPEPEILLRAAALRLATFQDDAAFQALRESEQIIRSGTHPALHEHLAFLQAELELGSPNPLTLGRVASGICLVCATSPRERVAFIRGDIMDDVRHSAWLVGRDQDRAVLREVFSLMGADQGSSGPWELRDAA